MSRSASPRRRPADRRRFAVARRRLALSAACVSVVVLVAGCADFSRPDPTYGAQPSLTPPAVVPVEPTPPRVGESSSPSPTPPSQSSQSAGSPPPSSAGSSEPEDPCHPNDEAVIAACLQAPWGLAVFGDGQSALVGERTTGKILRIAPRKDPVPYATVGGIDASGSGGLLGIAFSPAYDEDSLIYAYVTTKTDNRIMRLAPGDTPKTILAGIPKGDDHNGGRIEFGADGQLYIGTGDTGDAKLAGDPKSLAGKVLRVDEFGKPSKGNPDPSSPVFASGFTDVTGMCVLGQTVGALDHRAAQDVLIGVKAGGSYTNVPAGQAVWTWKKSQGGASDCSLASTQLGFSSLDAQRVVAVRTDAKGNFSGNPETLLDKKYGRLLTLTLGGAGTKEEIFWATTSNKDGKGKPTASDDRVIVIPAGGGGGGNGPD